jgi:DNA (cytosine-5)-methyltransferase 1
VTLTLGSLFTGIGGFELAAEWMGWRAVFHAEIDPYCTALLAERFSGIPNLGDVARIDWLGVPRPDILVGGFPCQDISYAGRGAGLAGARSGLWYEYARAVRELGPRYAVVENVAALATRGIDQVLGTLADLGYDAEWQMYGAANVGAPHNRQRWWILAYPSGRRSAVRDPGGGGCNREPRRGAGAESADGCTDIPNGQRERLERQLEGGPTSGSVDRPSDGRNPPEWAAQPEVGGMVDGVSPRLDRVFDVREWAAEWEGVPRIARGVTHRSHRIRGLGNAVVPACVVPIYRRIIEMEEGC